MYKKSIILIESYFERKTNLIKTVALKLKGLFRDQIKKSYGKRYLLTKLC